MKSRTIVFLFIASLVMMPAFSVRAYSVTCDNSIKSELWPYTTNRTEVKKLQIFLSERGYPVSITGWYSHQTVRALQAYQRSHSILPSGALGAMTRLKINQEICQAPVALFDPSEKTNTPVKQGILLDVPLIEQSYRLTCEAASMEMLLKFRGMRKTQTELMKLIGYATPYAKYLSGKTLIWGDPDLGFVGDEKGVMYTAAEGFRGATGWGVNPPPVLRVLKTFLPATTSKDQATIQDVIAALDAHKPVIFWHKRDDMIMETIQFMTPAGKNISFTSNHVAVIVGYDTDDKGQRSFIVNDPTFGRIVLDEETFLRWWGRWDNKMVISG